MLLAIGAYWGNTAQLASVEITMAEYVNLTPHAINLTNGVTFPPSGQVARVSQSYTEIDDNWICKAQWGKVYGVPEPKWGTFYIVSLVVSQALPDRMDVVSPASNHPEAVHNEKGHILAVPGFVK